MEVGADTSGLHPEVRHELWPLFDPAFRNAPHWLIQHWWEPAERLTLKALRAHGVTVDVDGFGYARSRKRKVDCNAVYGLLDAGLWWPILANKRLAIVSGHTDAFAARLLDPEFVRATRGGEISWSIATTVACPALHEPKHLYWLRMCDELLSSEWDLLLCSACSLAAIPCEQARQVGRKGIDIGALDAQILQGSTGTMK